MKQVARYRTLSIPNKLRVDVSIITDDRPTERVSVYEGNKTINITLNPFISITISRPWEADDDGKRVRPAWNPNDTLGLTRTTLPVFLSELKAINNGLKIKDLYVYQGSRLELNEKKAEGVRRVFMVGMTTLELSPIIITQPDETRVEGIKMKFNNEQSTVELTLNEICALIYNLDHIDVDSIGLKIYDMYIRNPDGPKVLDMATPKVNVDIAPKTTQTTPFNADDFI